MEKLTLEDTRLTPTQKKIIRLKEEHPRKSRKEIAKLADCSVGTVSRALRVWKGLQQNPPPARYESLFGVRMPPPDAKVTMPFLARMRRVEKEIKQLDNQS